MNTLVRNYDLFPSLLNGFFNEDYVERFTPSANIKENDGGYEVELALAGYNKEDFKIEVNNHTLTVSTESKSESEETEENYVRKEFSYNSFSRSFRLPKTVDSDKIEASYENGILKLEIPKKEEAKAKEPRLIAIN